MSSTSPLFSPHAQNTVWNVQTRIREIDASLHPLFKQELGEIRTFVYSILAGSCQFLDSVTEAGYSPEVVAFAQDVVKPVVESCFQEMAEYQKQKNGFNLDKLKLSLMEKVQKFLIYPSVNQFQTKVDVNLLKKLDALNLSGTFKLYKIPGSDAYYGGRIEIDDKIFKAAIKVMEEAGYRQEGDLDGSSFDTIGHVTTLHPRELAEGYNGIVQAHENFVAAVKAIQLKPTSIRFGNPPTGRLSRAVVISVDAPEIASYRKACRLGDLIPEAHISIFTQVAQPLESLKAVTLIQYLDKPTPYLRRFKEIWERYKQQNLPPLEGPVLRKAV
jgi:hypothetical protein